MDNSEGWEYTALFALTKKELLEQIKQLVEAGWQQESVHWHRANPARGWTRGHYTAIVRRPKAAT